VLASVYAFSEYPHVEAYVELSKKTTILLSPELYEHLTRTAKVRGKSLGQLVREACEAQYGYVSTEDRLRAVADLRRLSLPVGSPLDMKQESVPGPDAVLPDRHQGGS